MMEISQGTESSAQLPPPPQMAEELLIKMQELEASKGHLKQEICASSRQSSPLQRESRSRDECSGSGIGGSGRVAPAEVGLTDRQYLNILESMGQAVHIFDHSGCIFYWNRAAEELYGYSAAEAIGQDIIELVIESKNFKVAEQIVHQLTSGEDWTGQFPVRNKRGERFVIFVTGSPFNDDDGTMVGVLCVTCNSQLFTEFKAETDSSFSRSRSTLSTNVGRDPQQSLQVAIASKISNLASKVSNTVKSKMRAGENLMDREVGSGGSHRSYRGFSEAASAPQGEIHPSCRVFSHASHDERSRGKHSRDSGDVKPGISKIITSKAEAWIGKKGVRWPWKGNEPEGSEVKTTCFLWPWLRNDHENELGWQRRDSDSLKQEDQEGDTNHTTNCEAPCSRSASLNVDSTSNSTSCGSTSSSAADKVDVDTEYLEYGILWEDLKIGE